MKRKTRSIEDEPGINLANWIDASADTHTEAGGMYAEQLRFKRSDSAVGVVCISAGASAITQSALRNVVSEPIVMQY
jgi:hypothetical protein